VGWRELKRVAPAETMKLALSLGRTYGLTNCTEYVQYVQYVLGGYLPARVRIGDFQGPRGSSFLNLERVLGSRT
jgi:hypothetical protein